MLIEFSDNMDEVVFCARDNVRKNTLPSSKGAFVKELTIPQAPRDYQGHTIAKTAFPFQKPKAKGGSTEYFFKNYTKRSRSPNPYIATVEAAGAEFLRLVFSPHYTPKVRAVKPQYTSRISMPYVISRKINFKTFGNSSPMERADILMNKKAGIAKYLLTVFCFGECDLHKDNAGIDQQGELVKIDHDCLFDDFSNQLLPDRDRFSGEISEDCLQDWPNLIYTPLDMFSIISEEDVIQMPRFRVIKPWNHPLDCFFYSHFRNPEYEKLSHDPELIQWKYFYLTKYFILLTPDTVKMIIRDHSVGTDQQDQAFEKKVLSRRQAIEEILLHMPEYREFLYYMMPAEELMKTLDAEIVDFNNTFCDTHGNPKPHKAYRMIVQKEVRSEYQELLARAHEAEALDRAHPEWIEKKRIEIQIAKIEREKNACILLENGLISQEEWLKKLNQEMTRIGSTIEIHAINSLRRFAEKYAPKFKFPEKRPLAMIADDLKNHLKTYQNFLKTKLSSHLEEMTDVACFLICHKQALLSDENIKTIWQLCEETKHHFSIVILITHMMQHITLPNIPHSIFQWLMEHAITSSMLSRVYDHNLNHAIFKNWYDIVTELKNILQAPLTQIHIDPEHNSSTVSNTVNSHDLVKKVLVLLMQQVTQLRVSAKELVRLSQILGYSKDTYLCLTDLHETSDHVETLIEKNPSAEDLVPFEFLLKLTIQDGMLLKLICEKIITPAPTWMTRAAFFSDPLPQPSSTAPSPIPFSAFLHRNPPRAH